MYIACMHTWSNAFFVIMHADACLSQSFKTVSVIEVRCNLLFTRHVAFIQTGLLNEHLYLLSILHSSYMNAAIYEPGFRLSRYIDNFMLVDINWKEDMQEHSVWRLIPFGQVSMLFLFGDAHQYNLEGPQYKMQLTHRAFMVGQLTRPIWLKFSGHTRLIKIQFKSAGVHQLLPFNMQQFTNEPSLDLEAVWGAPVNLLLEKLYHAQTDEQRIADMKHFLEERILPPSEMIDYVDFTINQLKLNRGNISIQTMEKRLGISGRHLERLFRTKVGLSPKELSKIIRLNHALQELKADAGISLLSLSHATGYYDQAHFSRDFKSIAGVAPSKLLSEASSELFVTHGKCFV